MSIRCADCGCFPEDCKRSKSNGECPNCTLDKCCCLISDQEEILGIIKDSEYKRLDTSEQEFYGIT